MKLMLWLRALIFWFLFCITIICYGIVLFVCIPFTSKEGRYAIVKKWCRAVVGLMRTICGVRYEITGMDNVPASGPVILLSKHQSGWETLAFFALVPRRLSYIYKRELHRLPIFGWGLASLGMFSVDRSEGRTAFERMKREVPDFFAHGWALVLFPEGTRTAPGASVKYKTGGVRLAIATNAPIVPIALNSGECWPKHSFLLYPGTIKVVFGDPISPEGKTPHELNEEVRHTAALQEGAEDDKHDYELGADVHRRGEHALGGVEQAVDYRVKTLAAGKGVNQQRARHAEYGQAHAAAAELRQHQQADNSDDVVRHGHAYGAGELHAERIIGEAVVEERSRAQDHEHNVVPGQGVYLDVLLAGRIGEEAEHDYAAHKRRQPYLYGGPGGQRGNNAVEGERGHNDVNDYLLPALPDARVRLTVVLAHDGLDVLHGADVRVALRLV